MSVSSILKGLAMAGKVLDKNEAGSREALMDLGRALVAQLEIPSEFQHRTFWAELAQSAIIRMAVDTRLFQHLKEASAAGLSAACLSSKTGIDVVLLQRLARHLVAMYLIAFQEGTFRATALSNGLAEESYQHSICFCYDTARPSFNGFSEHFKKRGGLSIIAAAFVSHSVTLGLGRHTAAVIAEHGVERVTLTAKWQVLGYPFNIGSYSFPNISIAILINNLLDPNPLRARLLMAMSIMQVIFALISVFLIYLQYTPTRGLWDHTITGDCWPQLVFYDFTYFVGAYTKVTDIILVVVPISVFWKLQMRRSTKTAVCVMMGLMLLSAVVTIVKTTYMPLFTDQVDPLYNVTPLVIWGLIEQNVVIVAACIPTLRPFFRRVFESTKGPSSSGNGNNTASARGGARSGSAFKLSSNLTHVGSKRRPSVAEIPLDGTPHGDFDENENEHDHDHEDGYGHGYDAESGSNSSQRGIWQTREVIVV